MHDTLIKKTHAADVDPFMRYGAGIVTYFRLLEGLIMNMIAFSIIMSVAMVLYYRNGKYMKEGISFYATI